MRSQEPLPAFPAGLLSVYTPGLVFKEIIHRNKPVLSGWIPKDREQDFISGEGARNHTKYYVKEVKPTEKVTALTNAFPQKSTGYTQRPVTDPPEWSRYVSLN